MSTEICQHKNTRGTCDNAQCVFRPTQEKGKCQHESCDRSCWQQNPHTPVQEGWEQRFDKEFTHTGGFGERRFSIFRTNDYHRNSHLVLDDQVIADLKDFIRTQRTQAREEGMQYVLDAIERRAAEFLNDPAQCLAIIGEYCAELSHSLRLSHHD